MSKNKFRVMKFDGDDQYSYAIFHADQVRGMSSPICYSPSPILCGMDYREANLRKKEMEAQANKDEECKDTFSALFADYA